MNAERQARSGMEIAKGIATCFALNALHLGAAMLLLRSSLGKDSRSIASIAYDLIAGFSLLQLVYVIPLVFFARLKEHAGFAKGVVIGASVAFLLNATCFGLVMTGKIKMFD